MKRTEKIAALAAFIALTGAAAYAEEGPRKGPKEITRVEALQKAGERFDRADTNADGILTAEEMRAGMEKMREGKGDRPKGGRQHFDKADADGSGALSFEEFKNAARKMSERRPDFSEDRAEKMAEHVFKQIDTDNSGDLSKDEMKAAEKRHKGPRKGPQDAPKH